MNAPLFISPTAQCSTCGERIVESDHIIVTERGHVEKIGGLGVYKDMLTLRDVFKTIEHEHCAKKP